MVLKKRMPFSAIVKINQYTSESILIQLGNSTNLTKMQCVITESFMSTFLKNESTSTLDIHHK